MIEPGLKGKSQQMEITFPGKERVSQRAAAMYSCTDNKPGHPCIIAQMINQDMGIVVSCDVDMISQNRAHKGGIEFQWHLEISADVCGNSYNLHPFHARNIELPYNNSWDI